MVTMEGVEGPIKLMTKLYHQLMSSINPARAITYLPCGPFHPSSSTGFGMPVPQSASGSHSKTSISQWIVYIISQGATLLERGDARKKKHPDLCLLLLLLALTVFFAVKEGTSHRDRNGRTAIVSTGCPAHPAAADAP